MITIEEARKLTDSVRYSIMESIEQQKVEELERLLPVAMSFIEDAAGHGKYETAVCNYYKECDLKDREIKESVSYRLEAELEAKGYKVMVSENPALHLFYIKISWEK